MVRMGGDHFVIRGHGHEGLPVGSGGRTSMCWVRPEENEIGCPNDPFADSQDSGSGDGGQSSDNEEDEDSNTTDSESNNQDQDFDGDGYTPNEGDCNDNNPEINPGATDYCGDGIDQDCNGGDVTCTIKPDLHITSVKGGLSSEDYDDMNNSITENMYPGQCKNLSFIARYVNEADQEAKEVDFDWRGDQERNRFDEDDDKLCDENEEDVPANTKNKKTFNNAPLCVSEDGTYIKLTGPSGSIKSYFQWDEEKGVYIAKIHVFGDVEEKGRDDGDQDISSETKRDEYTEIEITRIPFTPILSTNVTSGTVPLTVFFADGTKEFVNEWYWTFGDGTISNDINPTHQYTKVGNFKATMTVGDGEFIASKSTTITVKEPPKPTITITNPTSSDDWRSSSDHTIRWDFANLPYGEPIKVEYSCDGGNQWRTIYDGYTTNDRSKKWKMDKSKTKDTSNGYIRILRRSDGSELGRSPRFKIDHAKGDPKW